MAIVKPLRALRYDPAKVSMDRVLAPPYDIISKDHEAELQGRDPHNAIRLELGQPNKANIENEARYRQAKKYLDEWVHQKVLVTEKKPGFYLHEMSYQHPFQAKTLSRLALFGLLKLEPFERKIVFGHEKIHASPKIDRDKLLRSTETNFSPVFTVYEDTAAVIDKIKTACESRPPLFDFKEDSAAPSGPIGPEGRRRHKVWFVSEEDHINRITEIFDRKRIFIADGHHRYSTALQYAEERNVKEGTAKDHPWDYVLSAFVRFTDPGLLVLPIHRVVYDAVPIEREAFLEGLRKYFILHSVSRSVLEKISEGSITEGFGLTFSENECYLLELKDKTTSRQAMPSGKPPLWYELDMNLVSFLILGPILKIDEPKLEWNIFYTPSLDEVFGKIKSKEALCAFVIRPVNCQAIKEICESGELMPQKSTYFYPKFPSGLLMYRHA
ncbi:MAG: DUF1015 domain-containing protein [Candidatus Omnitrophica bacterium]|nr:DUF1015 domain-containing protein [Candidatus Omnitrophota bacterium]